MSLRLKIMLLLAAMAATATVAIGAISYRAASAELERTVDRSLTAAARRFDERGPGGLVLGLDGRNGAERALSFEQVRWQLIDAAGNVVFTSSRETMPVDATDLAVAAGEVDRARGELEVDGESYRSLTIRFGDGAVMLARSLEETERATSEILRRTLGTVLLVAVVTLVLGWLLARQITRRLERLTTAAGEVATTGRLDVTVPIEGDDETGQLGRAFNGMLDALNRSRQEQHQLVQDAGHELRTPLTSLRTNVSVLRRRFEDLPPDAREQLLADLDSESRELTDLVNELVQLATEQRDDEPRQHVVVAGVVERAVARARRRSGREISVQADGSALDGRPAALERAVQNLVDNACKFAPDGVIEVTVAAGTVTVRDHGPGLTEADIPHLFDRFFRSVEMRSQPGSGLGLSIVKSIVEAHGGTVFARNAAGGGAEIGFTLPVTPVPSGQTPGTV